MCISLLCMIIFDFCFLLITQTCQPCAVDRDSYDGPVDKVVGGVLEMPIRKRDNPIVNEEATTSSGARNLHDSTFSLSG